MPQMTPAEQRRAQERADEAARRELRPAPERTSPPSAPGGAALRYAEVTGLYDGSAAAYTDYEAAGREFVAYVTAHPCAADGAGVDTASTVRIKTPRGSSGVLSSADDAAYGLAVGLVVGYLPGDRTEAAPDGEPYDGYYVAGVADGPALAGAILEDLP